MTTAAATTKATIMGIIGTIEMLPLLAVAFAFAAAAAAYPFDLYIHERYLNETTGRLCRGDGCACEATSSGMPPLRDLRFDGICLSYGAAGYSGGPERSLKYESQNNRTVVCENTYSDAACTGANLIDRTCLGIGSCGGGFQRYAKVLVDFCVESETPQGQYAVPFVGASLHLSEEDCKNATAPPFMESFLPSDDGLCLVMAVLDTPPRPYADSVVVSGSQLGYCGGKTYTTEFFSDSACSSKDNLTYATDFVRDDGCTMRADAWMSVSCQPPRIFCKDLSGETEHVVRTKDVAAQTDGIGDRSSLPTSSPSSSCFGNLLSPTVRFWWLAFSPLIEVIYYCFG